MTNALTPRAISAIPRAMLALALAAPTCFLSTAAAAEEQDDLAQRIDPNQSPGSGQVVLEQGHVDFGPTLNSEHGWKIQIHDATGTPFYWRDLSDVVLKVNDGALLQVPDNASYEFLGQEPGDSVWVMPQTQKTDVVWMGWNTQEPNVLASLNAGTTLSVLGVDGPGDIVAFLQSGNFGEPEPLFSTYKPLPQHSWIETNVHAHANWTFTEPGIYLVDIQFDAELTTGETVTARDTLRFAVGDDTDPQLAFTAQASGAAVADASAEEGVADETGAADETTAAQDSDGSVTSILLIVIAVVVAALVLALVTVGAASRRAKARVLAARRAKETAL